MFADRIEAYKEIERCREARLLAYVTGDRPGLEAQIHQDVLDCLLEHLDAIGVVKKIALLLYTRGGDTLAAWSIINLIHQFCDELEIIVPSKCHSAGTLMCLGANNIIMTKQATLGPIDPSINTPLNPRIVESDPRATIPVSVEAIKGYIELAKEELGIREDSGLTQVLMTLSDKVHPLVLGQVYRTRSQIQMLASRLLKRQLSDDKRARAAIDFLCSSSGSHDYTIHRREARDDLGLAIETPDDKLYRVIKAAYDSVLADLELTTRFEPSALLGSDNEAAYHVRNALLESVARGSHAYVVEGKVTALVVQPQPGIAQRVFQDQRSVRGWQPEE